MRGVEQIPWLYDGFMRLMEPLGLGRWRRRLVAAAHGRTLEVGCGTGRNLPLYGAECRVTGFDPSLEVVRVARRRAPGVPVVVARAEALPFRAESFDTVVSSLVFCSVPDPHRGLREVGRVLRDGGTLRMMEHVRHGNGLLGRLQDVTQPFWTWMTGGCHPNRRTEAAVERAWFRIEAATRRAQGVMRMFSASYSGPAGEATPAAKTPGGSERPSWSRSDPEPAPHPLPTPQQAHAPQGPSRPWGQTP